MLYPKVAPRVSPIVDLVDALPGLWSARETGILVPFVGAGISRDYCRGWAEFAQELARETNTAGAISQDPSPDDLYRIVDRAAAALRRYPVEERVRKIRNALRTDQTTWPKQALELAGHVWPLIVTTNYDDILPSIYRSKNAPPLILGRSQDDCARIVRSLDAEDQPLIWYVQGFVPVTDEAVRDDEYKRIECLVTEVVLGHQNYQSVINSAHAFRRAFSELFRRRSLVFVGSGLSESYFVNLIAESLHALGPGPFAHYALFSREEIARIDPDFLSVRLGITPVCYGDKYTQLKHALKSLAKRPERARQGTDEKHPAAMVSAFGFSVPSGEAGGSIDLTDVTIRHGFLPAPAVGRAIILSGGRDKVGNNFHPYLGGPMITSFFRHHEKCSRYRHAYFETGDQKDCRVFRFGSKVDASPIFVATSGADPDMDERDTATIVEATRRSLAAADQAGFASVYMGVLSAGDRAPGTRLQSLIAQLVGINLSLQGGFRNLKAIEIWTPDKEIWRFVSSGRVQLLDLLTSRLARILVRIEGSSGDWEEYALSVPNGETVQNVIERYDLQVSADQVLIKPLMRLGHSSPLQWTIFPGMTINVYSSKISS